MIRMDDDALDYSRPYPAIGVLSFGIFKELTSPGTVGEINRRSTGLGPLEYYIKTLLERPDDYRWD